MMREPVELLREPPLPPVPGGAGLPPAELGAHQQLHPGMAPRRVEQLEAVRLPVAHRDHARPAAHLADRLGGVGEAVQPAPGRPALPGLRPGVANRETD